ncbi:MAG: hypothetical protein EU536_02010 [Promethearchaeota archaeon]|nr:MAG: hypothetical protein EU536_02010 [Candidatus Lokiarchaeota archaeon]
MPIKGERKHSDIEITLNRINKIVNTINSANSEVELDIKFAEILSLLKTAFVNVNYKIEALKLIISELLRNLQFDQADSTFNQYSVIVYATFDRIENCLEHIQTSIFNSNENYDANLKSYQKDLTLYEKDWKNQKKQAINELKELQKTIEPQFNKWVNTSKREVEQALGALQKLHTGTQKKFAKFSELLSKQNYHEAKKILLNSRKRVQDELQRQQELFNQLKVATTDLSPLLGNLILQWKNALSDANEKIPNFIHAHYKELYGSLIQFNREKLHLFSHELDKRLSNLAALIEKKMLLLAEEVLLDTKIYFSSEYQLLRERSDEFNSEFSEMIDDLFSQWQKELTNIDIQINEKITLLEKELEKMMIKDYIAELKSFSENMNEKFTDISSSIATEKFAKAEKELEQCKKDAQALFEKQHRFISEIRQKENHTNKNKPSLQTWSFLLERIENEFQVSISRLKDEYITHHTPHLLNKIDRFITQNVEILTHLLEDYQTKIMNQFELHFTHPSDEIRTIMDTQIKIIIQELKNKDEHVQLVFARYETYPLEQKNEKWQDELKKIQNQFSELQMKLLNLIESRSKINSVLDTYYGIAQPAYGYKVPLMTLSDKLNISVESLELMFVDLISNKIISGEIDPVTKVIVLAPRIPQESIDKKKVMRLRCMVCNLTIEPVKEEIVYCPHCNTPAHRTHLIEWLKIKRTCPNCKKTIKML